MKKTLILLAFATATFCYAGIFSSGDSAQVGVAVVDLGKIMENSSASKSAQEKLASEFDARRAEIVEQANAFKQEYDDFTRDKALWTEEEATAKQDLLAKKSAELTAVQMSFEQEFYEAQNTVFQGLLEQVKATVNSIAKEKGYTLVLPTNQVLHFEASNDITDLVLPALSLTSDPAGQ